MWYPGKHNSLTFTSNVGERAKESLVKFCTNLSMDTFKNTERKVRAIVLMLMRKWLF